MHMCNVYVTYSRFVFSTSLIAYIVQKHNFYFLRQKTDSLYIWQLYQCHISVFLSLRIILYLITKSDIFLQVTSSTWVCQIEISLRIGFELMLLLLFQSPNSWKLLSVMHEMPRRYGIWLLLMQLYILTLFLTLDLNFSRSRYLRALFNFFEMLFKSCTKNEKPNSHRHNFNS